MHFIAKLRRIAIILALGASFGASFGGARAETAHVAVVANFAEPAREIADAFRESSGFDVVLVNGSAGAFMAQIVNGAPFEVFLSADEDRPKEAVDRGLAVTNSRFTYAIGTLVLWSRVFDVTDGEAFLRSGAFQKLALTNPAVGVYGAAAVETLQALGVYAAVEPKLVQGATISQVFQFVETTNVDAGFIALAQMRGVSGGRSWVVPEKLHGPILQDAVLLKTGAQNNAALAFMAFLKSPKAREIIKAYGYALP